MKDEEGGNGAKFEMGRTGHARRRKWTRSEGKARREGGARRGKDVPAYVRCIALYVVDRLGKAPRYAPGDELDFKVFKLRKRGKPMQVAGAGCSDVALGSG